MLCICRVPCQVRVNAGIMTFEIGDIAEFKKCPPHFEAIEGNAQYSIDFRTAGEEELLNAEYELQALLDFVKETYKKTLKGSKEEIVKKFVDIRMREDNIVDPNALAAIDPTKK